jgi:cytochrome c-type biogenesis protein CcmH/NrfF
LASAENLSAEAVFEAPGFPAGHRQSSASPSELVGFATMKQESLSARVRACRAAPARVHFFRRLALGGPFAVCLGLSAATLGSSALVPAMARADDAKPAATAAGLPPEEIERQAESISRSIMSPFCPGRTVSACPNAGPWREEIRKWVAEGVDSEEIKRRLGERVPEHNLAGVPKNRLGWVLPVGLGIGAIGILIFLLRYLVSAKAGGASAPREAAPAPAAAKGKAGASPAAARANGEDYDARLEQELDTLEQ